MLIISKAIIVENYGYSRNMSLYLSDVESIGIN